MNDINPVDLRQTEKYSEYIKNLGWNVDKFEKVYIFSKKLLLWNFVKIQRPNNLKVKDLDKYLNKKYKFSTIYIEPGDDVQYEDLLNSGFRKYNSPFLPSKTVQIDLTKKEDQLLSEMHQKTRYNIKVALRNRLKIAENQDIEKFADFWQKSAKERGMFLSQKKEIRSLFHAFGKEAVIHTAFDEKGSWLAGILRISTKDTSYYMYAASLKEGKKLFAPTILSWEVIKAAKKEGKKLFDFEGIYDERFPLNSWKGFTRFKKSFSVNEKLYPGCVSKTIV